MLYMSERNGKKMKRNNCLSENWRNIGWNITQGLEFSGIPSRVSFHFHYSFVHVPFTAILFFLIFLRSDIFFRCHLSSCKMPVEFQNFCYFLLRLTNQQTTNSQAPRRGKVYFARPPWQQIGFNVMFFLWFIFTCCQTSVLLLPFMTVMPKAEAMAKDTTWLIDLNSLGHAYF